MPDRDVIVVGAGGHSLVVLDCLAAMNGVNVIGLVDDSVPIGTMRLQARVLGRDSDLAGVYEPGQVALVNGIGGVKNTVKRTEVYERFVKLGYEFLSLRHPQSMVTRSARLEQGVQVMAGAVIQPNARIGHNSLINTGAIVDHECDIGAHVHIATGATLAGSVKIGDCVVVGAGSTILQGIRVGAGALVGAGAVVVRDVAPGEQVIGVPAKPRSRS